MTKTLDEEKGYLFYIYKVSSVGFDYKPVDPKAYTTDQLEHFTEVYAYDKKLYKKESDAKEKVDVLNEGLNVAFDYSETSHIELTKKVTIEKGNVVVTFPSGKTLKIVVDPIRETLTMIDNNGN